jgi:hypothetical protein
MVGRTARCSRITTFKPKCTQVEFIDENVNHSHWIFFGDVIVQALRQQRDVRPSLTFNESLHDRPRYDLDDQKILDNRRRFYTAWVGFSRSERAENRPIPALHKIYIRLRGGDIY